MEAKPIKEKISISLCKIGNCPATDDYMNEVSFFNKTYKFCDNMGKCDHKRNGIVTIEEEPEEHVFVGESLFTEEEIEKLSKPR